MGELVGQHAELLAGAQQDGIERLGEVVFGTELDAADDGFQFGGGGPVAGRLHA
jgi:hypothetical protein